MSTTNFGQGHTAQAQEAPVRGSGDGYRLRSRLPVTTSATDNYTPVRTENLTLVPTPGSENLTKHCQTTGVVHFVYLLSCRKIIIKLIYS